MRHFIADVRNPSEEGATATEYIFVIVFVAIALTFGMTALAGLVNSEMKDTGTTIGTVTDAQDGSAGTTAP